MQSGTTTQSKSSFGAPIVILAIILVAGGGLFWYLERERPAAPGPVLTAEAKAYVRNLKLSEVEMKAKENALKQTVVEITGKITNQGDRTLNLVEINCVFYDAYGQLVLRERAPIVRSTLKPGDTRSFRLPFDNLPSSWNQGMPNLVIAQIRF